MQYRKIKLYTGCLLPLAVFVVVGAAVFMAMWSDGTRYGLLTIGAPLGLGFCAALLVVALTSPLNKWLMIRELKREGSPERLAAWVSRQPALEFYIGPDGLWLNGQSYYWGRSLIIKFENSLLQKEPDGAVLVIKLSEDLGRSPRYFDVSVPVPQGREGEAELVVTKLLEANMVPAHQDQAGN